MDFNFLEENIETFKFSKPRKYKNQEIDAKCIKPLSGKIDFFAIPVFAGETGHFTYAIPKGYLPSSIDSSIYNKAIPTLNKYKRARIMYTKNGQTKAFKLFKKLN